MRSEVKDIGQAEARAFRRFTKGYRHTGTGGIPGTDQLIIYIYRVPHANYAYTTSFVLPSGGRRDFLPAGGGPGALLGAGGFVCAREQRRIRP